MQASTRESGRPTTYLPPEQAAMRYLPWRREEGIPDEPGDEFDRDLCREMSEGSREAMEHFVERHLGPLHSYLRRRLGPGHDEVIAQVCQAAFRDAVKRAKTYARGSVRMSGHTWLARLAEPHLSRRLKGKRRSSPAGEGSPKGTLEWLRESLDALPGKQQAALSLALFEGLPARELAHALGTTQAGAMRRLRAALIRISRRILAEA